MKNKLQMLKRLRDAREKLRDVAAGEVAVAERQRYAEECERQRRSGELRVVVDEASQRLRQATHVADLEAVSIDVRLAKGAVAEQGRRVDAAGKDAERALAALRTKEQDLRTSEKLVEQGKRQRNAAIAKIEEGAADDQSSARFQKLGS